LLLFPYALQAQNLNLASNKSTTASSVESPDYPASYATDSDNRTRWSSEFADNQILVVDLGSPQTVDRIRIAWEAAYGRDFVLQVSTDAGDASKWVTVQTVTNNTPTNRNNQYVNEFTGLNQFGKSYGQYVRLYGTARSTPYGYSIYEFEVFTFSNSSTSVAAGKPATASDSQDGFMPSYAFDGDDNTRWSTLNSTNQTLDVDLRGTATLSRVYINWELAYGVNFLLQASTDRQTWTTFATFSNNRAFYNEMAVVATGRYVRLLGQNGGQNSGGFSLFELKLFGSLVPLPVTLTSFTAVGQGTAVAVSWATATELHNDGFEVERSANGLDFKALGKVAGAGNSQTPRAYQYLDKSPLYPVSYYRLKQLDEDGTATYGPVVAVQLTPSLAASLSIFPNPTADQATVQWEAPSVGPGRWVLTSTTGQVLYQEAFAVHQGANKQVVDLRPYAAGSYVLTVEAAGQTLRRQLMQKTQ